MRDRRAAENQRFVDVDEPDSLQEVPAFQAFVAGIEDRCDIPPVASVLDDPVASAPLNSFPDH